ncbi:MAG: hypothetical protein HRU15_04830, partial [Planctomycetes bacterium]|nr:hypothetical protein [Planctomycetota bacterium]
MRLLTHLSMCIVLFTFTHYGHAAGKSGSAQLSPIADTYIATYPPGARDVHKKNSEQGGNAGASVRLKIKRFENMPILRFDFSSIPAGADITSAFIDLHLMNGAMLNQVAVSSLHADWNEGSGTFDDGENYTLDHDGACHIGPKGIQSTWRTYADSDFYLMFNGEGGSAVKIVKAQMIDKEICRIPVDPLVLNAAIEDAQSLVLCDHTGIFTGAHANIFFHSREVAGKGPQLTINWSEKQDTIKPAFKGTPTVKAGPSAGSIALTLPGAGDDGVTGTAVGYRLWVNEKPIDRMHFPRPQKPAQTCILNGFTAGEKLSIKIQAFDEANNTCETIIDGQSQSAFTSIFKNSLADQNQVGEVYSAKSFSAQIIDGMTLINPLNGK